MVVMTILIAAVVAEGLKVLFRDGKDMSVNEPVNILGTGRNRERPLIMVEASSLELSCCSVYIITKNFIVANFVNSA